MPPLAIGHDGHLFGDGGLIAWPFAIAAMRCCCGGSSARARYAVGGWVLRGAHAVLLWVVAIVAAHELSWLVSRYVTGDGVWRDIPWGVVPALALALVCNLAVRGGWPMAAHSRAYLVVGAIPLVLWMLMWAFVWVSPATGIPRPCRTCRSSIRSI